MFKIILKIMFILNACCIGFFGWMAATRPINWFVVIVNLGAVILTMERWRK